MSSPSDIVLHVQEEDTKGEPLSPSRSLSHSPSLSPNQSPTNKKQQQQQQERERYDNEQSLCSLTWCESDIEDTSLSLSLLRVGVMDLPDEILYDIFSFFSAKELCSLSLVSKRLYSLSLRPPLWKILLVRDFDAKFPRPMKYTDMVTKARLTHSTFSHPISPSLSLSSPPNDKQRKQISSPGRIGIAKSQSSSSLRDKEREEDDQGKGDNVEGREKENERENGKEKENEKERERERENDAVGIAIKERKEREEREGKSLKEEYERLFKYISGRRKRREVLKRSEERRERRNRQKKIFLSLWDGFHIRILTIILPLLLLLSTVFISLRLDKSSGISIETTLAPLFLALSLLSLAILSVAIVKRNSDFPLFEKVIHRDLGCIPFFQSEIVGESKTAILSALSLFLSLFLWLLFMLLRLDGQVTWHYSVVFIPIWFSFLLLLLSPCMNWRFTEEKFGSYLLLWLLLLLPLLIVCILLCVRLDGDNSLSASLILIPLFIVDSLYLALPLVTSTIAVISHLMNCTAISYTSGEVKNIVSLCCLSYIVFVPLTVFEALIALKDQGTDITYVAVFSPLIVWESFLFIGGLAIGLCS